ncbi:MAG: hypothetical protein LBU13_06915 [Synergistaceae bacterium]|jgi:hypothetical protein|nr:hypothetical protein [Synergistaceae bacterium]
MNRMDEHTNLLQRIRNLGKDKNIIPPRERERIARDKKKRDEDMERKLQQ